MDVVEGITMSLRREGESDRVYSFVQGIMRKFERTFDERYGDELADEEIVLLPGKNIVIHKKLGFDSSWYGTPSPVIHYGEKHDKLLDEFQERWSARNQNYFVNNTGSLMNRGMLSGYSYNYLVDGLLKERDTWEAWHEDYEIEPIPPERIDHVNEALHMGLEHDFLIIPSTGLLMEPLIAKIGIDAIGRHAYRSPDFLEKICKTIMKVPYEKMRFLCKTDAPVIIIPDDCAYKGRPILSPRMYEKFIIPHFSKVIKMAHDAGKLVIFHSDGKVEPYYNLLIEAGLDAHQSIEPVAGNNLAEIKQTYGDRLSFIGNIDCSRLLPYGSRYEVIEAVKDCLRVGAPGGGYMFSPCTDLTDSCTLENVEVMMATYKKFRTYPITIP